MLKCTGYSRKMLLIQLWLGLEEMSSENIVNSLHLKLMCQRYIEYMYLGIPALRYSFNVGFHVLRYPYRYLHGLLQKVGIRKPRSPVDELLLLTSHAELIARIGFYSQLVIVLKS